MWIQDGAGFYKLKNDRQYNSQKEKKQMDKQYSHKHYIEK